MPDDIETYSYQPRTPLHRVGLHPDVMPESLYQILWDHQFSEMDMLYAGMSIEPDMFRTIFDAYPGAGYEEIEEELRKRLSAEFIHDLNDNWSRYQLFLGPRLKKLAKVALYSDLLVIPGVQSIKECLHETIGPFLRVSIKHDVRTAFMLPKVHEKTGRPIHTVLVA